MNIKFKGLLLIFTSFFREDDEFQLSGNEGEDEPFKIEESFEDVTEEPKRKKSSSKSRKRGRKPKQTNKE